MAVAFVLRLLRIVEYATLSYLKVNTGLSSNDLQTCSTKLWLQLYDRTPQGITCGVKGNHPHEHLAHLMPCGKCFPLWPQPTGSPGWSCMTQLNLRLLLNAKGLAGPH